MQSVMTTYNYRSDQSDLKNNLLLPLQGFGPEAKTRGGTLGSPACTCIHTKGLSRKY